MLIRSAALFGLGLVAVVQASALAALQGRVESRTFTGPITGKTVKYSIYLPPGYDSGTARYPVVYHLHGIGGVHNGQQVSTVPASFEAAAGQNLIGPVIIVFPDGYSDSFWADSIGGNKPAETDVVRQLVPHVDATFRTIADARSRVMQGFSMGGFGATKFAFKFPEVFGMCLEYDGALLTWANVVASHPQQAQAIFGNSEAYFNQFSPWFWMNEHRAIIDRGYPTRMMAGALVPGNQRFRNGLLNLNLPIDYTETGCPHTVGCLFTAEGVESAAWIGARLGRTNCPPDLSSDRLVDDADFVLFARAYELLTCDAGTMPFNCPADQNGDGFVDDTDFAAFAQAYDALICPL